MLQDNFTQSLPEKQTEYPITPPGYDSRLSQSQRFGATIERYALGRLQEFGYEAELVSDFNAAYDIKLHTASGDVLPIEVKARRPVRQNRKARRPRYVWPFDLAGGLTEQDHIFILCQIHDTGEVSSYVVPSAFLTGAGRRSVCLTSPSDSYSGYLKPFLEDWAGQIETVITWRQKHQALQAGQLPLFDFGATVTQPETHNEVTQ